METKDFKFTFLTDRTPQEVFQAVLNVRKWWTGYHNEEITGSTESLNDEFSFSAAGGMHQSTQKIVEIIPNEKVVWLITDSMLGFVKKTDEWIGTKVIFEIAQVNDKTQLTFIHKGLTPEIECYKSCSPSWTAYLQHRLLPLINGKKLTAATVQE